uniref:Uncharacterized protein n=1 Tax=Arundo donax TaxID=35708 RepID=A0A0A9GUH8_ARUDO
MFEKWIAIHTYRGYICIQFVFRSIFLANKHYFSFCE